MYPANRTPMGKEAGIERKGAVVGKENRDKTVMTHLDVKSVIIKSGIVGHHPLSMKSLIKS